MPFFVHIERFLEKQSDWLTIIFLPKRSPNLNPVEIKVNRNLKKDIYAANIPVVEQFEIKIVKHLSKIVTIKNPLSSKKNLYINKKSIRTFVR
jgi:hypothetical protein